MKPITILKKHNLNTKSSVHGVYDYGANYAIALNGEAMINRRGFHLNDEDLKNVLFNLPKELESYVRFIENDNEIKWHDEKISNIKEKVVEVVRQVAEEVKEKVTPKLKKKAIDVIEEQIEDEANALANVFKGNESVLDIDYSAFSKDELERHRNGLKSFAKELKIRIHPATKDIAKIIAKIKDKLE